MNLKYIFYQLKVLFIIIFFSAYPLEFLCNHFSKKNNSMMLSLRNGDKFIINPISSECSIVLEVEYMNMYTPRDFKIKKDDVVIDIGAHIGAFSIFAARQVGVNGVVYAFEPLPKNFDVFQKNIILNNMNNIIISDKAIDSKKGDKVLYNNYDENSASPSFFTDYGFGEVLVNTITLDDVLLDNNINHIDFLKIDCEGAEYDILMNLSDKAFNIIDKIVLEYHLIDKVYNHNLDELLVFLKKKGFSTKYDDKMIYAKK